MPIVIGSGGWSILDSGVGVLVFLILLTIDLNGKNSAFLIAYSVIVGACALLFIGVFLDWFLFWHELQWHELILIPEDANTKYCEKKGTCFVIWRDHFIELCLWITVTFFYYLLIRNKAENDA